MLIKYRSVNGYSYFLTEKGDARTKIDALKKVIQMILNGEKMPSLLMIIIRFVMPMQDHTIKKLLLVFWEVVPKYTPEGKLLQEFILVCDAYRKVGLTYRVYVFMYVKEEEGFYIHIYKELVLFKVAVNLGLLTSPEFPQTELM